MVDFNVELISKHLPMILISKSSQDSNLILTQCRRSVPEVSKCSRLMETKSAPSLDKRKSRIQFLCNPMALLVAPHRILYPVLRRQVSLFVSKKERKRRIALWPMFKLQTNQTMTTGFIQTTRLSLCLMTAIPSCYSIHALKLRSHYFQMVSLLATKTSILVLKV